METNNTEEIDLEIDVSTFLTQLAALCNEFGIEISLCPDCGGVALMVTDKHIEEYGFDEGHISAVYATEVKAA